MDISLSDFDSSSESSTSEDQDDIEYMFGGQASCILSNLEETIGKIDNFLSFERGYILGDIVCLITDPSGHRGKVIDVDMFVDLESIHGLKMKHVNSKRLQKIKSLSVGDHVVQGQWLGMVDRIVDCIRVLFEDGTKCDFTTMGPEKLVPVSPDILEDSQLLFYPGQRVRIEPSSFVKSARWLCGKQNRKQDEGIVCAVDAGLVYVDWLGCAVVGCESGPAPSCVQDSKNLKLLSCFSHANWQMGDWCKLANADDNCVTEQIAFDASNYVSIEVYKQSENVFQTKNFIPTFQEIFVIVKKKTKVDVLWQDGSLSVGLDPDSLFPIDVLEAHDFFPDQFVLEKGTCDDPHAPCIQRWGVVRSVDAGERTVKVKWKTFAADQMNNLEKVQVEEIVSAYELVEHPDYSFCLGDVVFRFEKDHFMDIVNGKNLKYCMANNFEGVEEDGHRGKFWAQIQSEYDGNNHFSHIGIVIGFKDEDVEVKWVTGLTTKVAPYEIFQIDKHEHILGSPVPHENNPNISYEEMTDHVNQTLGSKGKDLFELNGNDKDCHVRLWNSIAFLFPRAAIGFLTSIAGSFFGSLCSISLSSTSDHISEYSKRPKIPNDKEVLEPCNLCNREPSLLEADSQGFVETSDLKAEETLTNKDLPFSSGLTYANEFRHFDMVEHCLDHHFVNSAGEAQMLSQVKRSWLKKVQKEWSLLEKDLPETIYVRVYEERMDFLRAAIVGAPGTPYHDGLFFFDIFLPPEYPQVPPMVHYISGGLRLNPNLYESGKICLSLLNTWTGTGSEVWNSSGSTILQVLLSLQALVLNEKPYFNEAGYDKQIGQANGMKNSVSYNENAFIVSCKSVLYLLRKPPKHFEALVHEHFSKRCKYILSACKEYMEGVPVGFSSGYQTPELDNQKGSSTGFKIMLGKLFPKLLEAFSENGMDCSQFLKPEN